VDDFKGQSKMRGPSVAIIGFSLIALGLLLFFAVRSRTSNTAETAPAKSSAESKAGTNQQYLEHLRRARRTATPATAEEIVASKVSQFGRDRRGIVHAMARHHGVDVPADVEQFFDAIEANDWEQAKAVFATMRRGLVDSEPGREELTKLWPAILETYGAAEQANMWPAQKLLDYGKAALGSLREGMVYIGGTDEGRFIPTLLNETSEGKRHMILTQNAFADQSYLEYVNYLYGDRLGTLTKDESQRAFQEYISDAQKRFQHDRDFPDEPKQVRPGEELRMIENRFQVSGAVAVMDINERLLRTLMEKNPDVTFAMQESFPLPSTYEGATPLGPIMELRAQQAQEPPSPERIAQSVDYWRSTVNEFLADPEARTSQAAQKSWAHLAVAQANFFSSQHFAAEAEQTYRLASQIAPTFLEPVAQLAKHLNQMGRGQEGLALLEQFARNHADQRAEVEKFRNTWLTQDPATGLPLQGFLEGRANQ
jgi:hypothetical protein